MSAIKSIGGGDPYFNKVTALMGFDALPFEDVKGNVVSNSNVLLANGIAQYGGAAEFNGIDSVLRLANSPSLVMGAGDFTQEIRFRLRSYPAGGQQRIIFSNAPQTGTQYADTTIGLNLQAGGNVRVQSSYSVFITGSKVLPLNQEICVAISRVNGTMYLFIDGQMDGSVASAQNFSTQADLYLGKEAFNANNIGETLDGYIDEFRITKGLGRYNANYAVPPSFLS
jgi:hypothetical protein